MMIRTNVLNIIDSFPKTHYIAIDNHSEKLSSTRQSPDWSKSHREKKGAIIRNRPNNTEMCCGSDY